MIITLCGSARFETEYHRWNERLTLQGHTVFSLAVFPSTKGEKNWYDEKTKQLLDEAHLRKIDASHAILVINPDGYIGDSTRREIEYAISHHKRVFSTWLSSHQVCPYAACADSLASRPCPLCYE